MFASLVRGFPRLLVASFRLPYLYFHAAAIVLTCIVVFSGIDWRFFELTRGYTFYWLVFGAGIGGFFVPVVGPLVLYLWGSVRKNARATHAAIRIWQVEAVAWLVSSTYKAFTGRIQPEFLTSFGTNDISREFHFGFWQHGIFWGWPSSHTCVAVAGAVMLARLYPEHHAVRYASYTYAIFIAVGAAVGFHWLSDVLAGALVAYAIAQSACALAKERMARGN